MEKNQVHIPIEAEFHMLRHFEQCSAQSLDRIRVQYTQEQIAAEMDTLSQEQKDKITFQTNRGLDLMHLQVDQLPPSNAYVLILKPIETGYHFITAFPGDEGMPLPYETLPEDLRKECKAYWDRHVFLDKGKVVE